MDNIRYIYWFAYYSPDSPSVRYRAYFPLRYMKENQGVESVLIVPGYHPVKMLRFLRAYFSALLFRKKNSIIVVQRVHSNFIYSNLLKLLVTVQKSNTVYDLDDADYLYMPPQSIYAFARKCALVAAGSKAIQAHLQPYAQATHILTSPTVDLGIVKTQRAERFTIGWVGSYGGDHQIGMETLVFPALLRLNFPFRLSLVGVRKDSDETCIRDYFKDCPDIELDIPRNLDWLDEHAIQQRIVQFDVGISTLLDTPIQRAKSGIKTKQYFNNGVPVLGSPLPENDEIIRDGINGFFCADSLAFEEAINRMYRMDEGSYRKLSSAARSSIHSFNHESFAKNLSLALRCASETELESSPAPLTE